jgi:hypothetical protein
MVISDRVRVVKLCKVAVKKRREGGDRWRRTEVGSLLVPSHSRTHNQRKERRGTTGITNWQRISGGRGRGNGAD